MAKTIVGTFDNLREAEHAAAKLEESGIERRAIAVIDNSVSQDYEEQSKGKSSGGFWSWLFGDVESEPGHGLAPEDTAYYSEQLGRGAAFVTVTVADDRAARVSELLERGGAEDVRAEPGVSSGSPTQDTRRSVEQERVVPIVEEELKVGKRTVERGGVRIYSHTTEKPVEEYLRLREERIKVERRPVNRPLESLSGQAFRDETIEFTESSEEPVIEKQARVVEEVVIGKDVREREETVRDTVRRGEVEVERIGGTNAFATLESDFRQHCTRTFSQGGLTYEQCSPAYRYGYELASNTKYRGDWATIEADARRDWEQRSPGTWERFKAAIRYSWDRGRGRADLAA